MNSINKLRNNQLIKVVVFMLCLLLPVVIGTNMFFSNTADISHVRNPYVFMSFGFYGCIVACLIWKSKLLKVLMLVINFIPGFFLVLGAMMGGGKAVLAVLLTMLLPFIPWFKIL